MRDDLRLVEVDETMTDLGSVFRHICVILGPMVGWPAQEIRIAML